MINHTERLVFDRTTEIHLYLITKVMSVIKKEVSTLELNTEVFHNFQQLKNRIISMTGKEDLTDNDLVDSLVTSFMHSYNQAE